MKTYAGIDMGTSAVKLLLIDESGNALATAAVEYEFSRPREGWTEADPQAWYDAAVEGLRTLLRGQDAGSVSAIGVTGQMHTTVLLDGDGNSLRPAIMWNDKRSAKYVPLLRERLMECPDGEYLSGIVSTGSPAASLYWTSCEEPELFALCRRFLIGPDYLVYRMTGRAGTDFCEASTSSLYGISGREWLKPMMELTGLPEAAFPQVRGSAEVVGGLLPSLAAEMGLSGDVRVVAGTGDNAASAISTGCLTGYPVLSLGTSGVLMFPVRSIDDVKKGKAILFSPDGKKFSYLVQGAVQSAGESVDWWTRRVLGIHEFGTLDGLIDNDMIMNSRVMFYPHINGDKTIYADPALRGAFIGLGGGTGAAEMYMAVIEGLCFAFRQLAEVMRLDLDACPSLKVVGGGAKSGLWLQTLSNVLGVRIERLGGESGPAFGAALLARASERDGGGLLPPVKVERGFVPEPRAAAMYRDRYQRYLRIHDALKLISGG